MNLKIISAASAAAVSLGLLFGIPIAMADPTPNCGPGQSVTSDGKCVNDPELIVAACVYLRLHGLPTNPANVNDPKYQEYFGRTDKGLLCIGQPPAVVVTTTTTVPAQPSQPVQEAKPQAQPVETHLPVTH